MIFGVKDNSFICSEVKLFLNDLFGFKVTLLFLTEVCLAFAIEMLVNILVLIVGINWLPLLYLLGERSAC